MGANPPTGYDGQAAQGTVGYGGGQPAYGGYDPDPSNPDPNQSDPDSNQGGPDKGGPDNGDAPLPIILDLSGQGVSITQLTSSSQFVVGEDAYDHRTAWAGAGSAVLFVDPNGDNAIRNADQYVFSDWDPAATSDMEALKDVFDTNHDGKLDAGDADFAQFKLMVTNADGTTSVETLADAGIASIDLTDNSVTQNFVDGSSIDGETTFTKTDGTTGTAASVTFAAEAGGTVLETPLVTVNPDGSTTIDDATIHPDGSLANETISTTSADGLTKNIAFDDAGNGIIDRRQTDDTVVGADGSKTETVSDTNGAGVLEDSTTTTTSADGSLVTITRDFDGSGIIGQSETRQTAADGSITDTLTDLAADGSTIDQTLTTFSADGLSKFTQVDVDGDGTFDRAEDGRVASVSASRQGLPRRSGVTGRRHRRPHEMHSRYCIQKCRATNPTATHRRKQILNAGEESTSVHRYNG